MLDGSISKGFGSLRSFKGRRLDMASFMKYRVRSVWCKMQNVDCALWFQHAPLSISPKTVEKLYRDQISFFANFLLY